MRRLPPTGVRSPVGMRSLPDSPLAGGPLPAAARSFALTRARALGVLGALVSCLLLVLSIASDDVVSSVAGHDVSAHPQRFFDERTFARAVARANETPVRPMPGARAVIVPHHWLAGHLIVGALRDLAASGDYRRVILIGPNHSGAGGYAATTSEWAWRTSFGTAQPDADAVRRLTDGGLVRSRPDVLTYEHSIAGLIPAIRSFLPHARVVPLALRNHLSRSRLEALSSAVSALVDETTIVIASVDFSHYLSAREARQRDAETVAALETLDTATILSYGNEHLDSPATVAVVQTAMRAIDATRFELRANLNASDLGASALRDVTSYIVGIYR